MWYQRFYVLEPLTRILSDKSKFNWTEVQQKSVDEMKNIWPIKILLRFPNFRLDFDVYTDTNDYQLCAVIVQKDWPVAFYSSKLSPAQQKYTVMKNELFFTIVTCVYFRNFLLVFKIKYFLRPSIISNLKEFVVGV